MKVLHVYDDGENLANKIRCTLNGKEVNEAVIQCLIEDYDVRLNLIKDESGYDTIYRYTSISA